MKNIRSVAAGLGMAFACLSSGANAAVTNTWKATTANTPLTAYDWNAPANWKYDAGIPSGEGSSATLPNSADAYFVRLADDPTVLRIWSAAANAQVLGNVKTEANSASRSSGGAIIYGDIIQGGGWGGGTVAGNWNALVSPTLAYTLTVRCDLFAESGSETRANPFTGNSSVFDNGGIVIYGPRGAEAATGTWRIAEGSPYAQLAGTAHDLAPGTAVTGDGIAPGTWLKRVFGTTGWIELSQAATATDAAAQLSFAAFTPKMTAVINDHHRGGNPCRAAIFRYREQDTARLEIKNMWQGDQKSVSYWGVTLTEMNSGLLPGDIVFKKIDSSKNGITNYLRNVRLELAGNFVTKGIDGTGGARPWMFEDSRYTARITVTNGLVAGFGQVKQLIGTLDKRGSGTLVLGMSDETATGTLKIGEGAVDLRLNGDISSFSLANLEIGPGAKLQLPAAGIAVDNFTAAAGAVISGPGKVTVVRSSCRDIDLGGIVLENGAELEFPNHPMTEAAAVPQQGLWMHLDASRFGDQTKVETTLVNGTNFVSKWFDVRGNGNYAARVVSAATTCVPDGFGDAWIRENADHGLPYVDLGPSVSKKYGADTLPV